MSLLLLENNWDLIRTKVIDKLWVYKFRYMYESCKLDRDDFDGLAEEVLTKAFKNDYNPEESSVCTFATNVLQRKAMTELTFYHREKRVGGVVSESLDRYVDGSDGVTLGEILPAKEVPEIDVLAQRYLDSLTKKQRQIAELMMQGCNDKDIKTILGMSNEQYRVAILNMKNDKKITPLKILKERMG